MWYGEICIRICFIHIKNGFLGVSENENNSQERKNNRLTLFQ